MGSVCHLDGDVDTNKPAVRTSTSVLPPPSTPLGVAIARKVGWKWPTFWGARRSPARDGHCSATRTVLIRRDELQGLVLLLVVLCDITIATATVSPDISLVVVGNPGVGKSFLCNIFLQENAFNHAWQVGACTKNAEFRTAVLSGDSGETPQVVHVHNVPGLIEHDPARMAANKQAIGQAFAQPGEHIIMYVFAPGRGGRLEASDFAAYEALRNAYNFQTTSVVFVFNLMPAYDDEIVGMAMRLIDWPANKPFNHVFIDHDPELASGSRPFDFKSNKAAAMRNRLLQAMDLAIPYRHEKIKEIELARDRVVQLEGVITSMEQKIAEAKQQVEDFGRQIGEANGQIAEGQRRHAEMVQYVETLRQEAQRARHDLEQERKKRKKRSWLSKLGDIVGVVMQRAVGQII
ncbi:GTPase, putative [Acanthamoeba castellanii str. Neff]|uniref:GTPase, putative n=1 Tax=Acanthamoeba castellanii (strain ATCC 30010 / Neff) TaxID=1257118 RepID=L8HGD9_ACACF|nr:GTPase, putative [Acanthamoeba castellanii str. Neff]ELR23793.1 GTPase, putative [Acanthamoeba castellanii str. Neff]